MVSKSEVLKRTGITYGQFYRWKRMGLIPEAWFNRRSTYTGQETFLPRAKVLERIRRINDLKDDHSLDDIAQMLSPDLVRKSYALAEIGKLGWLSKPALKVYESVRESDGEYGFNEVVLVAVIDHLMRDGALTPEQLELSARSLVANFESLGTDQGWQLTVVSRSSIGYSVVHSGTCHFDLDADVMATVDLDSVLERVKLKIGEAI